MSPMMELSFSKLVVSTTARVSIQTLKLSCAADPCFCEDDIGKQASHEVISIHVDMLQFRQRPTVAVQFPSHLGDDLHKHHQESC